MKIDFYHIDAFANTIFHGNPAAVCVLSAWLSADKLQAIAKENALPVTAFLVRDQDIFLIRWFTPEYELDICGHGALSAAYVIFNYLEPTRQKINLQSQSELLPVLRCDDLITLNFPARRIDATSSVLLEQALGVKPEEIYQYKDERYLAVYKTEKIVQTLKPDMQMLKQLTHRGVIVAAPGEKVDFVSRTFYPHKQTTEDAVTGASHCLLVPYWSQRLNKVDLHALQLSERGGELFCRHENERVLISGRAKLYMRGEIVLV